MEKELLYEVDKECPLCFLEFKATKVRNSLTMLGQDADFCVHYKELNPYYYAVWVCPHCGYAVGDTYFGPLGETAKSRLLQVLKGTTVSANFCGERDAAKAIASYKLAIHFAELLGVAASQRGSLYLKAAWIFRSMSDPQEQIYLSRALACYRDAYLKETFPIGKMSELTLCYLIGELSRRTGDLREAQQWFNKVLQDSRSASEPRIAAMARNQWQLLRDAKPVAGEGQ